MTSEQWELLKQVVAGKPCDPLPAGFIIDSPWLPNWAGMSILSYYANEQKWVDANLKAIGRFPQAMFLPGFWAEYGMCTEPSAFGAKCIFPEDEFPFAERLPNALDALKKPNPRTDGLAPFVMKRLGFAQPLIERAGHAIRFAVARGPLNVAGFLLGNTEFLVTLKLVPDAAHKLLTTITDYLVEWLQLQKAAFPGIDGILILDDIAGFCGEEDFLEFAKPYLKRIFNAFDASVRFFHNDANGTVCAPHLADTGVNLFNFSHEHPMPEMKRLVGGNVALIGNIPPRDVLAGGTPDDVGEAVRGLVASLDDRRGIILSCGGGMPPGVSTENIRAFLEAAAA